MTARLTSPSTRGLDDRGKVIFIGGSGHDIGPLNVTEVADRRSPAAPVGLGVVLPPTLSQPWYRCDRRDSGLYYKKCSIFGVTTIISMSVTCVTAYDGGSKVGNRIPWLTEGRELRSRDPGPILATWIGKWQECGFSAQVCIPWRSNPSPKG